MKIEQAGNTPEPNYPHGQETTKASLWLSLGGRLALTATLLKTFYHRGTETQRTAKNKDFEVLCVSVPLW
jgi:hypothetical protein